MNHIGNTYAQGLYTLACEEGLTHRLLQELSTLHASFVQEPEFLRLLDAPNIPKEERCGIIDSSFRDKVHPYVLNFLKLLAEHSYAKHFPDCCRAYRREYNRDNNILPVEAVTATALTAQQAQRLTQRLEQLTGKTVELSNRVDPAVIGGVRLHYAGIQVESTVASRLEALSQQLKSTVL
jgi:F-type H+-transporting ATPase subunit delta